jgi:cytochrome c oxidase subunit 3
MQKRYSDELDPTVKLKMKKNLIYVSIFSIVMIFAGFTSAYIVSMGDTFWVKYPLPTGFYISTVMIALSSIFYITAVKFSEKGQFQKLKLFMILTFLLGLSFVFFQWKGYVQLVDKGANPINSIITTEGKYGHYFEIKYLDKFITVNGNDYQIDGKNLNEKQSSELYKFINQFIIELKEFGNPLKKGKIKEIKFSKNITFNRFSLFYKGQKVLSHNKMLKLINGDTLKNLDLERLFQLSQNIKDGRGDFFHKGKFGKDFKIYYKGKELNYKNRDLYYKNRKLEGNLQIKISQQADTATSYLYIITILHLLHVLAAIIYLFRMVLITFKPSLTTDNQLSIKLGSIFWHFLGILWLYLLVFLLFIH